ncbi:MAG: AraC family transcriptional regulator [Caldilinea sp. CFX5]|nr:AraC family transcriptional regulator [Caldilinea sp. CFX5]
MQREQAKPTLSIADYDLVAESTSPSQLLQASEPTGWPDLLARCYWVGAMQMVSPAIQEDLLFIQVDGVTELQGKLVRRFLPRCSAPGAIYLVPSGEASEWASTGAVRLLHLYLPPSLLTTVTADVVNGDPASITLIERVTAHDPLLHQLGLALLAELETPGLAGRLYVEALTQTLVIHLLRDHAAIPQTPSPSKGGLAPIVLRRIVDYINSNLAHDLTLAEIAREANLSPYHFTRLFKQSIGESLHQYVIRQRVEAAKQLLLNEPLTIAEVATKVGFADQSHLGRHLKRLLGVTPQSLVKDRKNLPNQRKNLQDAAA